MYNIISIFRGMSRKHFLNIIKRYTCTMHNAADDDAIPAHITHTFSSIFELCFLSTLVLIALRSSISSNLMFSLVLPFLLFFYLFFSFLLLHFIYFYVIIETVAADNAAGCSFFSFSIDIIWECIEYEKHPQTLCRQLNPIDVCCMCNVYCVPFQSIKAYKRYTSNI